MMVRKEISKRKLPGASLVVQWLRCYVSTAWGTGLTPAQGAKILCVTQHGQKYRGGGGRGKEDVGRGLKKEACQVQTGAEDHATQETLGLEDLGSGRKEQTRLCCTGKCSVTMCVN